MSRLFTTYEEPLKNKIFTEEQMHDIYNNLADKTEYADFGFWFHDMIKSSVFIEI